MKNDLTKRDTGSLIGQFVKNIEPDKNKRKFTVEYKLGIIERADKCKIFGDLGKMLKKEGLHYSQLSAWKKQLSIDNDDNQTTEEADDHKKIIQSQKREIANLKAKLQKANSILKVQKFLTEILDN